MKVVLERDGDGYTNGITGPFNTHVEAMNWVRDVALVCAQEEWQEWRDEEGVTNTDDVFDTSWHDNGATCVTGSTWEVMDLFPPVVVAP